MRTKRALDQERIVIVILVFLGFAARVWRLGFQSLWLDEGLSVAFAGRPLPQMFSTLIYQDLHPPLYYLLLHFWMSLAGQGEFAVRFVSLWLGLPAVPATFVLGKVLFARGEVVASAPTPSRRRTALLDSRSERRSRKVSPTIEEVSSSVESVSLAEVLDQPAACRHSDDGYRFSQALWFPRGQAIGIIGAFLVAFSPFLVYYSQEARMYSALATFSVLSTYALWKLLETLRRRWLFAYVAWTAALLYTQYFGGLVMAFQALYLLGRMTHSRGRALRGILGLALVGILYVPWLPAAYLQMQRLFHVPDFWAGQLSLTFLLEHVFAAFALGQFSVLQRFAAVAIVVGALLFAGLFFLARQAFRRGGGELYVLTYLLVPLVILYAVLVKNPKFTERYLIMIAPAFYLTLALALVDLVDWTGRLRRDWVRGIGFVVPVGVALVLVGASFSQLWQVYYGPGYRKEDNRGATAYIEQHFQPGDIVILMMDPFSFPYYSRGKVPSVQLQPGNNVQDAANSLNSIVSGHKRVWLLLWNADWADPTDYVRHALETTYPQVPVNRKFTGLGLKLFTIDHPPHFTVRTTPEHAEPVDFGNRLELLGYDLPRSSISAGQTGQITLYWKPLKQLQHDYIVSLRLTDGEFYYWRHDRRPAADTYPTTSWPVGQVTTGELPFEVPLGTPPGTYYLEVGTYGQGEGSDLDVLKDGKIPMGTAVRVAAVTVTTPSEPADPAKLSIPNEQNVVLGENLDLLGFTLTPSRVPPGGTVDVTLWWQAQRANLPSYRVQLYLEGGRNRRLVVDEIPGSGRFPTDRWTKGELVEDKHRFVVPSEFTAGRAKISLQVIPKVGGEPLASPNGAAVDVGSIVVLDRPVQLTPPASVGTRVDWTFGSFAHLLGFRLDSVTARPGDHLHLTLYWRALGNSGDIGYTVFAHLLDQRSIIWAQQDHPPGDGKNPTSGWIAGEYVVDHYDLAVKPNAAPGTYQIEVGMYNPANGVRLPVRATSGKDAGDRVILATVQIK